MAKPLGIEARMNRLMDELDVDPRRTGMVLARAAGLAHGDTLSSTMKVLGGDRHQILTYLEQAALSLGFPPKGVTRK